MDLTNGEVSLYVHLPWCTSKCPYCDFNSYRIGSQLKEKYYVDSLLKDLEHEIIFSGVDRIGSIYFGGGTPSLFSGYSIRRLIDGISKRVHLKPYAEITLEMNPESADEKNLQEYRLAGINRISIGMQSFSDDVLSALERPHSASDGFDAFLSVRKAGFEKCAEVFDDMMQEDGIHPDVKCYNTIRTLTWLSLGNEDPLQKTVL